VCDQTSTIHNTYVAEDSTEQESPPPLPPPPINDEDYEEVDEAMKTRQRPHALDSAEIRTDFINPGNDWYEDMNGAAKGSPRQHVKPMQSKEPLYVGERDIKKISPDYVSSSNNYESLQIDTGSQSEYKELHNYGNIGRNSRNQTESDS
jgi:hypothetical protein